MKKDGFSTINHPAIGVPPFMETKKNGDLRTDCCEDGAPVETPRWAAWKLIHGWIGRAWA